MAGDLRELDEALVRLRRLWAASRASTVDDLGRRVEMSSVLVVEACNHSRIGEDIGTVQIPRILAARFPGVGIEHNFGREFLDNEQLAEYRLIIHCGGCMISPQKLQARVRDLAGVGVPLTNYGVFLAWAQGLDTLRRVLVPWDLDRLI